jgi:tripartite-type tricarboxylate transporter receptor subunit TctC
MTRLLFGLLLLCVGVAAPARAEEDVAAFYKDKIVRMVVGSAAGSGYDIGARAVARYMHQFIPGNPTIIVQNQPGAASITMTSGLYNSAPRDGTVIGAAINGMPTAPLLEPAAARFDPAKLYWLGSANREVQVTYVWHTAPVQKLADLYTTELIVGATTPGTSQVDFPLVANAVLGTKFKVISGYVGTTDIHKAMESGEVHGNGSSAYASLKAINAAWVNEGKVRIIAQWGSRKHPDLPDVPAMIDEAKNEPDRQALRLIMARLEYGRPFFAPPGLPPARAQALRHAFEQTLRDPGFLAEAEKLQLEIVPVSGDDVAQLVAQVSATPPEVVERVRAALNARHGNK